MKHKRSLSTSSSNVCIGTEIHTYLNLIIHTSFAWFTSEAPAGCAFSAIDKQTPILVGRYICLVILGYRLYTYTAMYNAFREGRWRREREYNSVTYIYAYIARYKEVEVQIIRVRPGCTYVRGSLPPYTVLNVLYTNCYVSFQF